jgi:Tfp pilus assembly protein PilO
LDSLNKLKLQDYLATLRWRVSRWSLRLNVVGVMGFSLLAFCVAFYFASLAPMLKELTLWRAEDSSQKPHKILSLTEQYRTDLAQFYAHVESVSELPNLLDQFHQLAKVQGIQLNMGKFKLIQAANHDSPIWRYETEFTLNDSYNKTRQFLSEVLQSNPTASLDEIVFKRNQIEASNVESHIKLSLYLVQR